jgi:hypothetical protein
VSDEHVAKHEGPRLARYTPPIDPVPGIDYAETFSRQHQLAAENLYAAMDRECLTNGTMPMTTDELRPLVRVIQYIEANPAKFISPDLLRDSYSVAYTEEVERERNDAVDQLTGLIEKVQKLEAQLAVREADPAFAAAELI